MESLWDEFKKMVRYRTDTRQSLKGVPSSNDTAQVKQEESPAKDHHGNQLKMVTHFRGDGDVVVECSICGWVDVEESAKLSGYTEEANRDS